MYSEALEKHWRWVLVAWRFCQLSRADCLSGKHLSDLIILDLIAIWQLWGMERLSLWCGGLFFCLLILGIFYLAIPQGVDDPPLLRAAIVVKKKTGFGRPSQPVNSRWIWVGGSACFSFGNSILPQDCCLAIRSAFFLVRKLRKPERFGEESSVKLWLVSWGVEIWLLLCENAWIY